MSSVNAGNFIIKDQTDSRRYQHQYQVKNISDQGDGMMNRKIIENIEQIEKEIVTSTSKPKMTITQNKNEIIVGATDTDGVKDIVINTVKSIKFFFNTFNNSALLFTGSFTILCANVEK